MTFSTFVRHWATVRPHVPATIHAAIGREALERARPVAYRATPLDFADLVDRLEAAIC